MKKIYYIIPCLIFVLFGNMSLSFAQENTSVPAIDFGPSEALTITGKSGSHIFDVEIADTLQEQARGLMFRNSLAPNKGMLFEFDTPKVSSIWMKNTAIPLDILFVQSSGRIIKIVHSHRPYTLQSVTSEAVVSGVVEIPGGRAQELGITVGDFVVHEFFQTP